MRRLLVILAGVVALAVPVSTQAGTTVERITFEDTFPLCNGKSDPHIGNAAGRNFGDRDSFRRRGGCDPLPSHRESPEWI